MPREAAFITFITHEFGALRGLFNIGLGVAVMALAPLVGRGWSRLVYVWIGVVLVTFAVGAWLQERYYAARVGRVKPIENAHRHPWYLMVAVAVLENVARRLEWRGAYGVFAIGLGLALAFDVRKSWRFRRHLFLMPLLIVWLGADWIRGVDPADQWTWIRNAVMLLGAALVVLGICDHVLLTGALEPGARRLALSAMPAPAGPAAVVHDPASAAMMTALLACSEADILFLARVAGLDTSEVLARLTTLFHQGLVFFEDSGWSRRKRKYARLTAAGRDVARSLWQTLPDERHWATRRA